MLILLCAATGIEARACRRAVRASREIEVLETGMGSPQAERRLRARLRSGPMPTEIISTGFAGGRADGLEVGSWVLGREVRGEIEGQGSDGGGEVLTLSPVEWEARLRSAGIEFRLVAIHTIAKVETGRKAKVRPIGDFETDLAECEAVDMESYALARVANEHGVRFQALRLISDTTLRPIPDAVATLAEGKQVRGVFEVVFSPFSMARFIRQTLPLPDELARVWGKLAAGSRGA